VSSKNGLRGAAPTADAVAGIAEAAAAEAETRDAAGVERERGREAAERERADARERRAAAKQGSRGRTLEAVNQELGKLSGVARADGKRGGAPAKGKSPKGKGKGKGKGVRWDDAAISKEKKKARK
jgi:hypothetical protein